MVIPYRDSVNEVGPPLKFQGGCSPQTFLASNNVTWTLTSYSKTCVVKISMSLPVKYKLVIS